MGNQFGQFNILGTAYQGYLIIDPATGLPVSPAGGGGFTTSLQINHPELQINEESNLVLAWPGIVLANFYVYNVVGLSLGLVLAGIAADSDGFIRLRVHNQTGAIVSPFILMAAAKQV